MSSLGTKPEDSQSVEQLFSVLSDKKNREILSALNEPKTATELTEECDMATSTVYRKLDELSNTELVVEHLAIESESGRCSRYERNIQHLSFSIGDDGQLTVQLERPKEKFNREKTWKPDGL